MSLEASNVVDTVKGMLQQLREHVDICVANNVAHATTTSNKWRSSAEHINSVARALVVILLQGGEASGSAKRFNAVQVVQNALTTMEGMNLVFSTDSRKKALKNAVDALRETLTAVKEADRFSVNQPGYQHPVTTTTTSSKPVQSTPCVPSGQVSEGKMGTNIKPTNFLTFSSAESSASVRLGVHGSCALCGASRPSGSTVCGSCGKASNIIIS